MPQKSPLQKKQKLVAGFFFTSTFNKNSLGTHLLLSVRESVYEQKLFYEQKNIALQECRNIKHSFAVEEV